MQSREGSMICRSGESGFRCAGSSRPSKGAKEGRTRAHSSKNGFMSTTRSRTTGSPARGSNRTSLRPGSSGVWQARMARPSMRSVQVPHIATRHEYLKPMDGSCSRWIARRRSRTIIGSILSIRKVLSAPGSLREIVTRTFEEGLGSVKDGSSPMPRSDQPVSFQVVEDELFLRGRNLVYQADFLHELRELDETVRLGSVGYPFLCNEPPELLRRRLAL